ncbi:DUF6543 domain-containing protein [Acerihabitans sp. TG2]|uniref:dermonecrotic toxin domain-containing protein n=1 Tax=Acerihabitans sp. TG2 TaxID=3096008 RepID=UPI002B22A9BC|nr:DUF6543 domain-containing protein [Acerihabitans sp. TG2]MEA9390299.1 DUF6543 domain-containing protein [Acerihabitans sp. TG2]
MKNNINHNNKKNKKKSQPCNQHKTLFTKQKGALALLVLTSLLIGVSQAKANSPVLRSTQYPPGTHGLTPVARADGYPQAQGRNLGTRGHVGQHVSFDNRIQQVGNVQKNSHYPVEMKKKKTEYISDEMNEVYRNVQENTYFINYAKQKFKIISTVNSLKKRYSEDFPDILRFAAAQMKQAIFNKTGLWVDPDKIFFHHFTSAENDPHAITGWRHDVSKPVESWTVTECLLKNFPADARDNMDVVDQMAGIYRVAENEVNSFGAENQVPIKPSTIANIVIEKDFFGSYIEKLSRYWQTDLQDMMNLYVFIQGLIKVNHDSEIYDFYLKAFNLIPDTDRQVKKYIFDINGYLATDMLVLTHNSAPYVAVYMPRSVNKLIKFDSLYEMKIWFSKSCADTKKSDEIAGYFSLKDRQDGFFFIGVDSWLKLLVGQKNDAGYLNKIWRNKHEVTGTVLEFLSARQELRAMDDADSLIKSNDEVRVDMAIRYFSVVDMMLPNPVTPFVTLGLGIEKMLNGDTPTDRQAGNQVVIGESINIALMAFSSVIEGRLPTYDEHDLSRAQLGIGGPDTSVSSVMQDAYLSARNHPAAVDSRVSHAEKFAAETAPVPVPADILGDANIDPVELARIDDKKVSQSRVSLAALTRVDIRGIHFDDLGNSFIVFAGKIYRLTPTGEQPIYFIGEELEQGLIYLKKSKSWKMVDYQQRKTGIFTSPCRVKRNVGPRAHYCLRVSSRVKKILDKNIDFSINYADFSRKLTLDPSKNIYFDDVNKTQYLRYGDRFFRLREERDGYAIYGATPASSKQKLLHVVSTDGKTLNYLSMRIEQVWEILQVAKMSFKPFKLKTLYPLNNDEINTLEQFKHTSGYYVNQFMLKSVSAENEPLTIKKQWAAQINNLHSALTKIVPQRCTTRKLGIIAERDFLQIKTNDFFETSGFTLASIKKKKAYQIRIMHEDDFIEVEYEFNLIKKGYPINHQAKDWSDTEILIPDGCLFKVDSVTEHTIVLSETEGRAALPVGTDVRKINVGTPDVAAFRLDRERIMMLELLKSDRKKQKYSAAYIEKYSPMLMDFAKQQTDFPAIEAYSEAGSDFVNNWLRFGIDSTDDVSVTASTEAQIMLGEYANLKDYIFPVYRAVYCPPEVYGGLIVEGDVIMDKGFMSASALPLNSLEWENSWSKNQAAHVRDVPVIFIVDRKVGKKIASTHLLLDHILIPPKTLLKVERISAVSDASGREVSVVCLSQGKRAGPVKNIYSGALMPNGPAH